MHSRALDTLDGVSRVLVVEDDETIGGVLASSLSAHGHEVSWQRTGCAALDVAGDTEFNLVLLDLGLPDVDGVEVCRTIRETTDLPIIIVSARGEVDDRILGLHSGADDYLVKPYDVGELVARVEAVYRRRRTALPGAGTPELIEVDGVSLDLARHTVVVDGAHVTLSRKEFQVLAMLATAGGAVCTRNRIVAEVWGRSWPGANRTLDVHVATLRTKLGRPELVQTVRGVGYRLGLPAPAE